jgi:hypothetical protein
MSKPWKVWVWGDMADRSWSQIPVPVPMSAMRAVEERLGGMDGWRR